MKSLKAHFTPAELGELLSYDAATGELRWITSTPNGSRSAGAIAGSMRPTKYLNINVRGKNFLAHRAAWALHFGAWPEGILDHINGCRSDNRIANLRLATIAQNSANSNPRARNKCGIKGVYQTATGRWRACIGVNGKNKFLGGFATAAEAGEAYQAAARKAYGEFFVPSRAAK